MKKFFCVGCGIRVKTPGLIADLFGNHNMKGEDGKEFDDGFRCKPCSDDWVGFVAKQRREHVQSAEK